MTAISAGCRVVLVQLGVALSAALGTTLDEKPAHVFDQVASLRGIAGEVFDPTPIPDGATVLVFFSTECPIANAVNPTLNALYEEFPPPRIKWFLVCVDPDAEPVELATYAKEYDVRAEIVVDPRGRLARRLGATKTPEVVVLDDQSRVRYQGRIDDQFAARGVRRASPGPGHLKPALAAVLDGREVSAPAVAAVGCPLPEVSEPTYARDVAPVIQNNCRECHRAGAIGPFPLDDYSQVRKRAGDLATIVEARTMPPWKAVPGVGPKFRFDRSLSPADIETIAAWAEAGAPEGDRRDLPDPRVFPEGWSMDGRPDLILDIGVDYTVAAEGGDDYRCFVIPTDLPDDVSISGVEYLPGNPRVVHHILGFVDVSGAARRRDETEDGPGYTSFSGPGVEVAGDLGGWAPGASPSMLDDGIGRSLPKKADIILQIHYHPSGKPETDRTRIGLKLAKKPIRQTFHWNAVYNSTFELPPGDSNVEVRASWKVPVDVEARAVAPHMHLLGKSMHMYVEFPDGGKRDLIRIDDWSFHWQTQYYYEEPIDLPEGAEVYVVAHFDNSLSNPLNPEPKLVRWGEGTQDEMCVGFIAVTKKGQDLTRPGEKDDLLSILKQQREQGGRRNDR